jgi:hypothetical protein
MIRRLAFVVLCVAGCKSQTPTSTSDTPVCTFADAGAPKPCMGCAVPEAQWGAAGPLSCPLSLADYCNVDNTSPAAAGGCPPADWSTLLATGSTTELDFYRCEDFNLWLSPFTCGLGTYVMFVYDGAGRLTSAVELKLGVGAEQQTCLAGPGSIQPFDLLPPHCEHNHCLPHVPQDLDAGIRCDLDGALTGD